MEGVRWCAIIRTLESSSILILRYYDDFMAIFSLEVDSSAAADTSVTCKVKDFQSDK